MESKGERRDMRPKNYPVNLIIVNLSNPNLLIAIHLSKNTENKTKQNKIV